MDRRRSRRELLFGFLSEFRSAAPRGPDSGTVLRPPGALAPDEAFLEACTGCADCAEVCPPKAIFMMEIGGACEVPAISPSMTACVLCDDLPCITACPDGALVFSGGPERVRIGIAKVDPRRCVTFKGQHCDHCYRTCPYPDRAIMIIGGRPLIGSGACTGCGLCEQACPEEPKAITVVAERLLIPGMRVPKNEYNSG